MIYREYTPAKKIAKLLRIQRQGWLFGTWCDRSLKEAEKTPRAAHWSDSGIACFPGNRRVFFDALIIQWATTKWLNVVTLLGWLSDSSKKRDCEVNA